MSSVKSYKFRLYPTRAQTEKLEWTLARCCELYNVALQERREMYTYTGKGTTYNAQAMQLTSDQRDQRGGHGGSASCTLSFQRHHYNLSFIKEG
ncbi:hypothetical protein KSD_55540 [Ktedonobacter sp. SOSP1-85]|uniref:helix-turn-helix domain-containing protein n=1 Tax=Ktedonobacter sp. SOSP1-85 TaxID=2778367 RepID=UPI001914EF2F|nr:helix-turn-helix domain-containing protein [Ktedonobacter sp. SOSP1-85]GHO77783.1 hypothetical protein KSD_55540 [Ktedonobacter sp. SOSP1-85]